MGFTLWIHAAFRTDNKRYSHFGPINTQGAEDEKAFVPCSPLMTHPGVGPVTALATEVFLGDPQRFADSKALASHGRCVRHQQSLFL